MLSPESSMWHLAAIVEVPFEDRVQCQCKICGHVIYKRIHMVVWGDGRIECWGQDCYRRELGVTQAGKASKPVCGSIDGRSLTLEERELLRNNREQLIAKFREEEQKAQSEREQEKALREAREKEKRLCTKPACFPPGRDVTSELARYRLASVSGGSQHSGWPPDREGTCKFCGRKTREWQSFFGSTGMCVCRDCYRQGKLAITFRESVVARE